MLELLLVFRIFFLIKKKIIIYVDFLSIVSLFQYFLHSFFSGWLVGLFLEGDARFVKDVQI